MPRAGTVFVDFFAGQLGVTCSAGGARLGLYLDGVPVPASSVPVPSNSLTGPLRLVPLADVTAGDHAASIGANCAGGTVTTSSYLRRQWTVTLLAE